LIRLRYKLFALPLKLQKILRDQINSTPDSKIKIILPQVLPLHEGEILGCTAPTISQEFAM
jgi:hypothetical protein